MWFIEFGRENTAKIVEYKKNITYWLLVSTHTILSWSVRVFAVNTNLQKNIVLLEKFPPKITMLKSPGAVRRSAGGFTTAALDIQRCGIIAGGCALDG